MVENQGKKVDAARQFETEEELLAYLNEEAEKNIHSWADIYSGMKALFATYRTNPCQNTADYAVFVMHCWVLALEDMPEEGDALTIVKKMNEIMVLGKERTCVSFLLGAEQRAKEQEEKKKVEIAINSLRALRGTLTSLTSMGDDPATKKTLH